MKRIMQRQAEENGAQMDPLSRSNIQSAQATATGSGAGLGGTPSPSGPLSLPSLDPSTLPGHFCITNRRFMEPRWIIGALAAAGSVLILALTLTGVFDLDIELTNDWREAHGLPRDTPANQYGNGAFFEGHRCFIYSIKVRWM